MWAGTMPWQLGVLLFLLAEKSSQVFNDDENMSHKQTMLFHTKEIDQHSHPQGSKGLSVFAGGQCVTPLCYADLCGESLPMPGVWSSYQRRCRSSSFLS
jgi:hypothetical protein